MIKSNKIISIVTPSYNQGEYVEETILSILSQQGDFYIDYIIMDGGSTDNSVEIICKYESLLKSNFICFESNGLKFYQKYRSSNLEYNNCLGISYRWISKKDNGQADAINKGLAMAKGNLFAFLNSDDMYYPKTLQKIFNENWLATDFIYGKGMWITKDGKDICLYPTFKPTKSNFSYQCTLCQPTVFFTKKVFRELGGFSLDYDFIFDYEYWMRALFNDKRFSPTNSLLAMSRMYYENKSISGQKKVRNEVAGLIKKYYTQDNTGLTKRSLFISKYMVHYNTIRIVLKLKIVLKVNILAQKIRLWLTHGKS